MWGLSCCPFSRGNELRNESAVIFLIFADYVNGSHWFFQTIVVMDFYCCALSGKYYKNSLDFQPERWLNKDKDENHAFTNLPFGFGTRMCLGKRPTLVEIDYVQFLLSPLDYRALDTLH